MRVLQLTFGTGLLFVMLFLSIRFWGEGQSHRPFDSSYWKASDEKLVVIPWEQNYFLEKNPDWILWADVYRGENQNLLVRPWVDRDIPVKKLEKISSPTRPLLIDLFKKFPKSRWIINCNDNVDEIHTQLAKVIEEAGAGERVIIQSEFNTILISTKEKAPMLLYGSTIADLTRLKVFDSLFLLPAAPFKTDLYFGPLKYMSRPTINRDISQELKKRFKKIFLGPLKSVDEIQQAQDLGADGFFLADPLLWKQ